MYDSLLEWDADLQIQPALAESYEVPDDTTYLFTLRQGVTFHDGSPLTAADVVYSLNHAINPPEPGIPVPFLANVATVEAVDDATVRVTMSQIDPTLPGLLAWGVYTPIVRDGAYEQINVLSEGIGTGPYRLVEYVQDESVVYEANPSYWKAGVPCISRLTLRPLADEQTRLASLRSGEVDGGTFSADVVVALEGNDEIQVLRGLTSSPRVMLFNTVNDVPWRDVRVRQAINKVIDRQVIIDNVYAGQAEMSGPIPPGYGAYPLSPERLAELYAVNVDEARALMADAGYADGFDVTLIAISAPRDYVQIAEVIREQVAQIGIDVTVEPLEIGTFAEHTGAGDFEWASTGRGMRGDPSGHVVDFRTGTPLNEIRFGEGWKNDELNALYDEALVTLDQDARVPMYQRIQELILTDAANIYTVQPYKFQAVNARVTGMYVYFGNTNPGLKTACVAGE
jgi:peptide/nickel transport system substrate-binding protein